MCRPAAACWAASWWWQYKGRVREGGGWKLGRDENKGREMRVGGSGLGQTRGRRRDDVQSRSFLLHCSSCLMDAMGAAGENEESGHQKRKQRRMYSVLFCALSPAETPPAPSVWRYGAYAVNSYERKARAVFSHACTWSHLAIKIWLLCSVDHSKTTTTRRRQHSRYSTPCGREIASSDADIHKRATPPCVE